MLAIASAVVYFGFNLGEVLWNYYQYTDRMEQEVRFAGSRSDAVIKRRIAQFADSIGLPEAAHRVHVKRGQKVISIWAEYYDNIEFPGFVREIRFNPKASGPF
jgi:hypothetical protein